MPRSPLSLALARQTGQTPVTDPKREQLRRCATAVYESLVAKGAPEGRATTSRAFAICTRSLQRSGYLEPGTATPTLRGAVRSMVKALSPDAEERRARYEAMLERARRPALAERVRRPALADLLPSRGRSRRVRRQRRSRLGKLIADSDRPGGSRSRVVPRLLRSELSALKDAMNVVFACDTAYGDCHPDNAVSGHCMLSAMVVQDLLGGKILGGQIGEIPHYWNRVGVYEVDLTGDQFGFAGVRIKRGRLHPSRQFYRAPGQVLDQPFNRNVLRLHRKFLRRLIPELTARGLGVYERRLSEQLAR